MPKDRLEDGQGYVSFFGGFIIEFSPRADTRNIPPSAEIEGTTITVSSGSFKATASGFIFNSRGTEFKLPTMYLQRIRRQKGGCVLWNNDAH